MKKGLLFGSAWIASDVYSLLQLAWLKQVFPHIYEGTMAFVSPIAMYIHVTALSAWAVARELAVEIAANTS
jgi:hypothetical protein